NNNVEKVVMLTGDRENISNAVAKELNLDECHAELLPQDKVSWVEKLMTQKSSRGKLIFIGDGINDAPVLALSDIGVAMGGLGSDAAIEAADVVIMTDEPSKIANSIQISKKTMRIVRQNIVFAIAIKIGVLILSALGLATMWAAVFADVGVSILAIINALRILKIKNKKE
ncbi:MAG: HAD-IC family P-type ATPase, partial [Bacilli bacterium]|nr:HAD-IC family P-type ATPase [Bacilli bacterium]